MNKLKGRDLDVEIDDFIGYADPDTATMVKRVLLPILKHIKHKFPIKILFIEISN